MTYEHFPGWQHDTFDPQPNPARRALDAMREKGQQLDAAKREFRIAKKEGIPADIQAHRQTVCGLLLELGDDLNFFEVQYGSETFDDTDAHLIVQNLHLVIQDGLSELGMV
jgi:hypothetical protein